jgi:hypothetical protein
MRGTKSASRSSAERRQRTADLTRDFAGSGAKLEGGASTTAAGRQIVQSHTRLRNPTDAFALEHRNPAALRRVL